MSDHHAQAADQEAIWAYFQNEAPESFAGSGARIRYLVARAGSRGAKVLNIGVGSGLFEQAAIKRGIDVFSLDPDDGIIAKLRQKWGLGEKARTGYGQAIPFDSNSFDTVVVSEVLEHLTDETLAQTLNEIERILKPGGRVIGTVPAREDLAAQTAVCPDCSRRFHRWGHLQRFDAARVTDLLARQFTVTTVSERPFMSFRHLNWKGKLVATFKLLLWRLGVHGASENVYFEAAKR